ncbi:ubiquitin-conjugating enzyme [Colletotrichum tofieldiae]|nr:ubiquitin-conjugating enzyme [Colletotrichum tofieldiae]
MFKCSTCAKTNLEIIQECEEAAKANADSSESMAEVEIPSELKLGYKDEMAKAAAGSGDQTAAAPGAPTPRTEAVDTESAELAEGFVHKHGNPERGASFTTFGGFVSSCSSGSRVPTPTRTVSLPPAPNVSVRQQAPPAARAYDEGVPLWIDRAIVVLVVLLLAMILKVLLDL